MLLIFSFLFFLVMKFVLKFCFIAMSCICLIYDSVDVCTKVLVVIHWVSSVSGPKGRDFSLFQWGNNSASLWAASGSVWYGSCKQCEGQNCDLALWRLEDFMACPLLYHSSLIFLLIPHSFSFFLHSCYFLFVYFILQVLFVSL